MFYSNKFHHKTLFLSKGRTTNFTTVRQPLMGEKTRIVTLKMKEGPLYVIIKKVPSSYTKEIPKKSHLGRFHIKLAQRHAKTLNFDCCDTITL
jgi:hypothetical protein